MATVACDSCGRVIKNIDRHSILLCHFARHRNKEALDSFIEENSPLIKSTLRRYVKCDQSTLDDLESEVVVNIIRGAPRFKCWRPAAPWLITIARNKAMDLLRARQRHPILYGTFGLGEIEEFRVQSSQLFLEPCTDDDETSLAIMLAEEHDAKIKAILSQIPAREQIALKLRYVDRLPYREIESRMGIRQVGPLLTKARTRLRELLA